MELMLNGHVLDFLNTKPTANRVTLVICVALMNKMKLIIIIFDEQVHQTALGLAYLHARGIIHGDLKAVRCATCPGPLSTLIDV
jgi:serine/threonine protein kinase